MVNLKVCWKLDLFLFQILPFLLHYTFAILGLRLPSGLPAALPAVSLKRSKSSFILAVWMLLKMHWGVESTHWSLDVTFREDASRTRKGKAPKNLALLRRLALNVVKKDREKYPKRSLKARRFSASLNTDYLDYLLSINFG